MFQKQMIERFEKNLINKLNYKASSKITLDALLMKSFKFYDLKSVNHVPRDQFYRCIAKIGVVFQTQEEMAAVFDYYDKTGQERIYYRQFIKEVLHKPQVLTEKVIQNRGNIQLQLKQSKIQGIKSVSQSRKLQRSKKQTKLNTSQEIINYIKQNLRASGIESILKLAVSLKEQDVNKSHQLSHQKINFVFDYLKKQDISKLFEFFKTSPSGELNYAQLVYSLRQMLSSEKTALINSTFSRLDLKNEGQILIDILVNKFQSNSTYSKQQYKNMIDYYCRFQGIDDGVFTDEDFTDFFGFISFYFQTQQDFRSYILSVYPDQDKKSIKSNKSRRQYDNSTFNQQKEPQIYGDFKKKDIHQSRYTQHNHQIQKAQSVISKKTKNNQKEIKQSRVSNQSHYIKQIELILLRIKKRLASKGPRGYLLFEKALRLVDSDSDNLINLLQFKKVIKQQRIDITQTQNHIVFQIFDQQSTGLINYPQFIYAIRGEVSQNRKKLIQRVWEKIKISNQITTFNQIKHSFQARAHPDVKNGRRYQQQIIKQLHQSILLVQDLNDGRNEQITKSDIFDYFFNLSAATADDQLFQTTLINVWKLGSITRIQDQYAGSRKLFDMKKNAYLTDHHRYMINGGTVSQNAPFGTYNQKTSYTTESGRRDQI